MAQNRARPLCRLQAVTRTQSEELPEDVQKAFEQAALQLERPGAFESRAIAVHDEAFTALTGFSPLSGEFIPPEAVKRSIDFASAARIRALINAKTSLRNDYIALGVFLRVCAANTLGLKAEFLSPSARR
jgi:hypothetical protein